MSPWLFEYWQLFFAAGFAAMLCAYLEEVEL